jgi:ABC-type lipoprotein export system ATPase subunit
MHDRDVAALANRLIFVRDGQIESDTKQTPSRQKAARA